MILHIDMSNHYRQKKYSVIAMVSVDIENKRDNILMKGIILEEPSRSILLEKYGDVKLHAALISLLLEGVTPIEKVIVCCDVLPIEKVFGYASDMCQGAVFGKFKSLIELRREAGEPRLKSYADALAGRISKAFPKKNNIHTGEARYLVRLKLR